MSPRTALSATLFALLLTATPQFPADDHVIGSGVWTKKTSSIEGSWKIVTRGDQHFVLLDDDFKTRSAPDLKIYLSRESLSELTGNNATNSAVLVAELERTKGSQEYPIPAGIDPSEYESLLIHCVKYAKLWGAATIPAHTH